MSNTLKYNYLAFCLFLVISGKICAAEIGVLGSGKGNFTIPENSTITVNNTESVVGINVGNQDQYLLNGAIKININSTASSATGINLSGTGQLNLGENSTVIVQAEKNATGVRSTGKNDFTAESLGLKIYSNENETVRGFDLSSNAIVNLKGQNFIEVDNKNHTAVGVYLFSQPGSKSIFNANDLTISKSGTGIFSGINSNVNLSGITNISASNIGLDAAGVSAVPNIGGIITADQIKIVSDSIGVKAQESGKIYIGKGSSVETKAGGYGLFATSRVNNNTPQETIIEFNGDANTFNLVKVKDGIAVFANNALATINLKYTNIDITSELNDSYGLVAQNGATINANTISIVASDLNANNSNVSSIYATGNGSKINLEGFTSIDTSRTNQNVSIYNRNLAVINILGDIESKGDKVAIDNSNSTINIYGLNSTFAGDIKNNNNGVISLSNYDLNKPIQGVLFGKLNIGGDFTGTGGVLKIDTKLASDNVNKSNTDFITIDGAATGSTELKVINAGSSGARTYKGIHIIQTGSSTSNAFFIGNKGYVTTGAYDYGLFLDNNNWYLRSKRNDGGTDVDDPVYTPDVGEYLATETMGNTLFTSRLEDREGASQYQNLDNKNVGNIWVRAYGGHNQFKTMESQLKTTGNSFVTQMGTGLVTFGEEDQYNLGVLGGFAYYDGKTRSDITTRESKTKIDGYSLGFYGTWYAHPVERRGVYIDSWVLWNQFNNSIDTPDQNKYKFNSSGVTASIEVGGDYLIKQNGKNNWWVQPQSQLIYQGVHAENFKDAQGVDVYHGEDNLQARMGIKTYLNIPTSRNKLTSYRPYIALNVIHNTNPYSIIIDDMRYTNEGSKTQGEFKVGLEGNTTKNSQVWLNASYATGSHNNEAYRGNIGWKYNF